MSRSLRFINMLQISVKAIMPFVKLDDFLELGARNSVPFEFVLN